MATLQDYYNTGGTNARTLSQTTVWKAQTFTANQNYDIASVKIELAKNVGITGTATVSIKAVDGSSQPTGADLASGTTDIGTVPDVGAGSEWREITFGASYSLVSGTKYAIVIRSGDQNGTWYWFGDSTSPTYAGGQLEDSVDSGSTWVGQPTWDMMFETYDAGGTVYAEGTKTVTAAGSVSLTSQLLVMTEGTKAVTAAASISLSTEAYKSNTGFPTDRPSDYDPDTYWDEENGVWSSTRTVGPGNWAQYVVTVSEEGEIYFGTV